MTILGTFDEFAPQLRRDPDVAAHDLVAADASDRLILREAIGAEIAREGGEAAIAVVGDRFGALTLPLLANGHTVRLHTDAITGELALRRNARALGVALERLTIRALDPELTVGTDLVLGQLPRGLDALDELAWTIAEGAPRNVRVALGGRLKHLSPGVRTVLSRHFAEVRGSLAANKSRVLHATQPINTACAWPKVRHDVASGITIAAHGAAFAGANVDIGTRFLLEFLPSMREASVIVDLGCGTGVLAASIARQREHARVIATDRSAAAVASARATAAANGLASRIEVVRDDALATQAEASAELILLNPPFHSGAAVTDAIAPRLFADAARVLVPGGELWCVYNSHLGYREQLKRIVGPTEQLGRNSKFTVTRSRAR